MKKRILEPARYSVSLCPLNHHFIIIKKGFFTGILLCLGHSFFIVAKVLFKSSEHINIKKSYISFVLLFHVAIKWLKKFLTFFKNYLFGCAGLL